MCNHILKTMKKFMFLQAAIVAFFTLTVGTTQAFSLIETTFQQDVKITSHSVTPGDYDPSSGTQLTINYCLNTPAQVTVGIYEPYGDTGSKKAAILTYQTTKDAGCYTATWNGKYGDMNEIGNKGQTVDDGNYFYTISAKGISGYSKGTDDKYKWIKVGEVDEGSNSAKPKIVDFEAENSIFDPEDDQEANFTFTIDKDAYITVEVLDEDEEEIATLIDEEFYSKGDYSFDWDGQDEEAETVSQGEYTLRLKAKNDSGKDTETVTIQVKEGYEDNKDTKEPRLKNIFVTKDNFDPGRNESTKVVFTMMTQGDVTVAIYKGDDKIETLVDSDDVAPGTYIAEWDGEAAINKPGDYTFRIYTQNDKGKDVETGAIEVEEDYKEGKKPNIYRDEVDEIAYSPENNNLDITFKLEREAEVTLEIREGNDVVATVSEEEYMPEGSNTITWSGQDDDGDYVLDGVYTYKLIAGNDAGKDVEKGYFLVEDSGIAKHGELCSNFVDVQDDYVYCEAIEWAVTEGIFKGYNDATFKPDQALQRSEALKVILEALDVKTVDGGGQTGFTDVSSNDWFVSYLKTALNLGIVHGYNDGTFKPTKPVIRAEALVMLLNTAKAKDGVIIPSNSYGQPYFDIPMNADSSWYISYTWFAKTYSLNDNENYFYPTQNMTRGQMADMLYRYHKADL